MLPLLLYLLLPFMLPYQTDSCIALQHTAAQVNPRGQWYTAEGQHSGDR